MRGYRSDDRSGRLGLEKASKSALDWHREYDYRQRQMASLKTIVGVKIQAYAAVKRLTNAAGREGETRYIGDVAKISDT